MIKKALLVFWLGTLIPAILTAQEKKVWTLEECIDYALEHNISLKKQFLNTQYQEELLRQSKLNILPSINAGATHGYNWGKRVDPFTNEFATDRIRSNDLNLSGSLNLFSGFQQLNEIRRNKLALMKAQLDADYYEDDLSIQVATEYLQVLYYTEYVEMAQNQLAISKLQVDRTRKMVDAGTLAKGDLLTIEAQYASEELSLVQAQNNLTLAYLNLSQLMELQSPEGLTVEQPELGLLDPVNLLTPDQIYAAAIGVRPEIKSAEYNVESSLLGLKIAQGALYPRLTLTGLIGTGYSGANLIGNDTIYLPPTPFAQTASGELVYPLGQQFGFGSYDPKPFNDQINDNLYESVGLRLSVPIFNGWSARSQVAQAKIGIENANLDLELQKNTLYKIIQQAYNDAVSAMNQFRAATKKVDATAESFKYAEQKFNVGMINSVDYNNAKKEYNNALSELIQAKYEYVFRTTVIDFYMGKPLTLNR
ncbi:MAG: TolC family protein [Bacteroidales bacterium]